MTLGEVNGLRFCETMLALDGKNERISVTSAVGVSTEPQGTAVWKRSSEGIGHVEDLDETICQSFL